VTILQKQPHIKNGEKLLNYRNLASDISCLAKVGSEDAAPLTHLDLLMIHTRIQEETKRFSSF